MVVADVVVGADHLLRHHERLVVEFERVVVVGARGVVVAVGPRRHVVVAVLARAVVVAVRPRRGVVVPVVRVLRHRAHGPRVLVGGVRVGVGRVRLVRRDRRRRHRAVGSGRRR